MSNEYKDYLLEQKNESIDEKFKRLLSYLNDFHKDCELDDATYDMLYDLADELHDDVREKLNFGRCKDCDSFVEADIYGYECNAIDIYLVNPDDYCSWFRKKESSSLKEIEN